MLRKLQIDFVEAILSGKDKNVTPYIYAPSTDAAKRLAIYKNNTYSNLANTLKSVYPIVEKLVGTAFFNQVAKEFIKIHFSVSGDLNEYGNGFAEFLNSYPPALDLPYLPDVADLEWAMEKAYYAPDHEPLAVERIAALAPEQYGNLRFMLHPTVSLIKSSYPLYKIWEVHQPHYEGDDFVELGSGGVSLLITRRGLQSALELLSPAEYIFLKQISQGSLFTDAAEATLNEDTDFPLQAFLIAKVTDSDIVDFEVL